MIYKFDTYDTVQVCFGQAGKPYVSIDLSEYVTTRCFVVNVELMWDASGNNNSISNMDIYNSIIGCCVQVGKIHSISRCRMVLIEKHDLKMKEAILAVFPYLD
jgi:hypothetical protein